MGGQDSNDGKDPKKDLKKASDGSINKGGPDNLNYAKAVSTPTYPSSIPPSQKTAPSPPAAVTSSSNSTPNSIIVNSSATSSPAALQEKIDHMQWSTVEWFGHGDYWQNDFVRWIILATEEKVSSEKDIIERGLDVIKRETNEIYSAGMINLDSYSYCIDLISKCSDVRLNFDETKRNELLNIVFGRLQVGFDQANVIIRTIAGMSVEQRSVLRFMTHQKIQARIAFLRTSLRTFKEPNDMEGYHCTTNPYYKSLQEGFNSVKASNSDLNRKYTEAINLCDQLLDEKGRLAEENNRLKKQPEAKDDQLSSQFLVKEIIENYASIKSEYEAKSKESHDKMKSEHEAHIKKFQERNDKLQEHIDKMKSEYETDITKLQERNDKLQEHNDKMKSEYEAHINLFQEEAKELRKEAKSAKDEAHNYQAALGSATSVRWSDSTLNNPIQLTKDIEKFQHLLTDFTKVKGKFIKINETAAKQLLEKYDCKANPNSREIKNYLAAALQRMILETMFANVDSLYRYAKNAMNFTDGHLESYIVYFSQNLDRYMKLLTTNREGKDSITAVAPIKIRQQVYAALGSRGFDKSNNPTMRKYVNEILSKMEKYREVIDEEKKSELNSEAEKIIRTGMQLLFRLKAQEPLPKVQWFKSGDRIESHLMVGSWEDENIKEMEVDFAFFPLIITEHDKQVFNKSQVFVRPKQKRFYFFS